jgi:hypothetical protein
MAQVPGALQPATGLRPGGKRAYFPNRKGGMSLPTDINLVGNFQPAIWGEFSRR